MVKLAYISPSYFLEVDLQLISKLNKRFDLLWIVIFDKERREYDETDVRQYCHDNQVKTIIYSRKYRRRSPYSLKIDFSIIRSIKAFRPSVIYFETIEDIYLNLLTLLFLKRKQIVVGIHDVQPHPKFIGGFHRLNNLLYFKAFKNYQFFSQTQMELFNKQYSGKNTYLARMLLKDYGDPPSTKRMNTNGQFNFLFFGAIRYNKGLEFLIEAAQRLAQTGARFKVTIAGLTDHFDIYERLINQQNLFDLQIRIIPNKEIPRLFSEADYLVLPYRDVTQSGPLLISYRYRVPVIASDFPGFREYIKNGENGFLFEAGNIDALEKCMENVLLMSGKRKAMIKNNLEKFIAGNISEESILLSYSNLFNKIAYECSDHSTKS
ncbi:MAG: glycosyltransferase family 4 protein [Bacteroidota bacterium]|nr:glycosyltransferase family 4 protein [Bacteroidota bacterium]